MATIEADLEPAGLRLRDYLDILSRRRVRMVVAFLIGLTISLALAFFLPARYQSIATILIEQQELPTDLVRSTVTSYADQRVQVISQRVMTTQTMLDIIRRYNLYPRERERESREALMKRMRDDISVKMVSAEVIDPRSGKPTAATIAFTVAYSNPSPEQAARVANELTTLYLNENLTTRTRLAEEAQSFLQTEAEHVSQHIEELEVQLAKFKSKHIETLPDLMQLNMSLLDRTQQSLEATETRKASLEQQLVYLQAQLVQLKPNSVMYSESGDRIMTPADRLKAARAELANDRALYAPNHPDIQRLEREVAGLEAQTDSDGPADLNDLRRSLDEAKGEAAEASKRYAPDHPDRIRLQHQVETLQEELATATAAAAAKPAVAPVKQTSDNPAYIQIQAQIAATHDDLDALAAEQGRLRAQLADYQGRITASPQVESEYHELVRDYDNSRAKYQELRSKAGEATTARDLETDRKGERFTLIEPPLVPQEPVSPNRLLIGILGAVLSIGLAIGAAALTESLDGTVRGRRDLSQLLGGLSPLAIIPQITFTGDEPASRPWRRTLIRVAVGFAVLAAALAAVHFFYRPLDVLWFVMLRKFGLG